ncbi:MAG: UPF0489 family protein [Calditrichaceae bacterium]
MSNNIYDFYHGFFIDQPAGNNAFSFSRRKNKKIYVPSLIRGDLCDLSVGNEIVFSEIEDGVEKNKHGLKKFIHRTVNEKDIFIFDNHNHAFFFWMWGWFQRKVKSNTVLVHIDQHTDLRQPKNPFPGKLKKNLSLEKVFRYTNYVLNVGNFIQPALNFGLISSLEMINSTAAFDNPVPAKYILDIDMDIFAPELDYMDNSLKIAKIQSYITSASFITMATSPYFIEQERAVKFIHQIFEFVV